MGINKTFEQYSILFEFKKNKNFNRKNTLSILRLQFEPDVEIGRNGTLCKGLTDVF